MDITESVILVKWLIINGNKYIGGKSMIVSDVEDTLPAFGLVKDILIVNSYLLRLKLYAVELSILICWHKK